MNGVIAVSRSENSKIGTVAATYVSQVSCPKSCPFMKSGCYAESGPMGVHTSRLNKHAAAGKLSKLQLARNEAAAIDGMAVVGLPLRLHVVGDSTTNQTAKIVSAAASRYRARGGGKVWTYTHAWRSVDHASWQRGVSVIASCETIADTKLAMQRGYAAAVVVSEHAGVDGKATLRDGVRVIPCPQQTGKSASCVTCGLCFDADRLRDGKMVIEFATHGSGIKKATNALVQIGGSNAIN